MDQKVQFHLISRNAQKKRLAGENIFREIRLGQSTVDYEDTIADDRGNLVFWSMDEVEGYVGDNLPGNVEPKLFYRVGAQINSETATHCNFAGDDCWRVKVHPKVDSVSASTGYKTGGQEITINGYGLEAADLNDVSVKVDGVDCAVKTSAIDSIVCETGVATTDSVTGVDQPGVKGIAKDLIDPTDDAVNPSWTNLIDGSHPVKNTTLFTSFEDYRDLERTRLGGWYKGWFNAPETGNYRFFLSCDDACKLLMDTSNPYNAASPVTPVPVQLAIRHWAIGFRSYNHPQDANDANIHVSDWISLVAGESYYMEGHHLEYGHGEHFTVSMEFQSADSTAHPKASTSVQKFHISHTNVAEEWTLTINNPDSGSFLLNFIVATANGPVVKQTLPMNADMSAGTLRQRIVQLVYTKFYGSNIEVTKLRYDVNDVVTDVTADVVKAIYTIKVLKRINQASASTISAVPIDTAASVVATPPMGGILSSTPLSGNFIISCPDANGVA